MDRLTASLAGVRRGLAALRLTEAALGLLLAAALPLPLAVLLAAAGVPWPAAWLVWLTGTGLLLVSERRRPRREVSRNGAARRLEAAHPQLGDELRSAVELETGASPFAALQHRRAEALLAAADSRRAVPWRELRRPALAGVLLAATYALLLSAAPGPWTSGWRALAGGEIRPPVPRLLEVTPGDAALPPGTPVTVTARFDAPPAEARLRWRPASGGPWREQPLQSGNDGTETSLALTLPPLTEPLVYQVLHRDGSGPLGRLTLLPAPRLRELQLKIVPPAYTGLDPFLPPSGEGSVGAPLGSRVEFTAAFSLPLSAARLVVDGEPRPLPAVGESVRREGSFTPLASGDWRLEVTASSGLAGTTPRYTLTALPDAPPTLELDSPRGEYILDATMTVPLVLRTTDDYGVERLTLEYARRGAEGTPRELSIARGLGREAEVRYRWELGGEDLLPGEELLCRVIASDGNTVTGPGRTAGPLFVVRFPGIEEIVTAGAFENPTAELESLGENQQELARQLEELEREHRAEREVGWEEERQLRRMVEEQAATVEQAEELVQRLEATLKTLNEQSLLTPESYAKLGQVQQLLEQVLNEELKEQLREMQRAVESLDRQELERLAAQFQSSRAEFEAGLDRMLELLRRAQAEQQLAELAQAAREAAQAAEELTREPAADEAGEQSARIGELEQAADEAAQALREADPGDALLQQSAEQVAAAGSELDSSGAEELSKAAESELQAGENASAGVKLQQVAAAMTLFSQQLSGSLAEMRAGLNSRLEEELAAQVQALLLLARSQEEARQAAARPENLRDGGALARRLAENAAGLRRVAAGLEEVYRQSAFMNVELINRLGKLADELAADGTKAAAGKYESSAAAQQLAAINTLGMELLQVQQQASAAQSSTGLSELMAQLGKMAADQQAVNQATQGAGMPQPGADGTPGGGMPIPMPGGASGASLAARQAAIRLGLEQLAQRYGELENLMGNLGGMAGQAGEIEELLRRGALGEQTQQEQQVLLRRLLDAQRSLNEDELSRQRESQQARPYRPVSPPPLEIETPAEAGALAPTTPLLDPLLFPPEYRPLIREYLRRLRGE